MDTLRSDTSKDTLLNSRMPAGCNALNKHFVFVIGAPRSGTTWLVQMLSDHPAVASIPQELTLFSRYVAPWLEHYEMEAQKHEEGAWSLGMPMLYDREEFRTLLRKLIDGCYERVLARNPEASHIMDKHPYYSQHLPAIDHVIPHARFIHIIRDGREVAVSMMSARKRIGFGAKDVRMAARNWSECVLRAREQAAKLGPERYMEIRYEDLMSDPITGLTKAFAFSGLNIGQDRVRSLAEEYHISKKQLSYGDFRLNHLRDRPGAIWKERLSLEERYIFDLIAGHLLQELGYARADWWALTRKDRLKMTIYSFEQRLLRSVNDLSVIWRSPIAKRIQ